MSPTVPLGNTAPTVPKLLHSPYLPTAQYLLTAALLCLGRISQGKIDVNKLPKLSMNANSLQVEIAHFLLSNPQALLL